MSSSQKVRHIAEHIANRGFVAALDTSFGPIVIPASVLPAGDDTLHTDIEALASWTRGTIELTPPATGKYWPETVLRYQQRVRADLVAIPAAKRGLWQSLFLDPGVRTVCSLSAAPVWVSGDEPILSGSSVRPRIVCAVNLQEGSDAVVYWANRFATAISANITILYAMPEITEGSLAESLLDPAVVLSETEAQKSLRLLADHCTNPVKTQLLHGAAGPEIIQFAGGYPSALLLTGRKRRHKRQCGLGATATHILRRSRHPVVVVPG